LLRQIQTLARHADLLIVDAGHQPTDLMARLWQAAHVVLLVTTPEAAAVMDTYALVKQLLSSRRLAQPPALVVGQATSAQEAADVHRRIDQSCRRFLGLAVAYAGHVPARSGGAGSPGAVPAHTPAISELARQLTNHRPHASQPLAA
jgi:MinD-like ATPase involved in chromosome partitioning or flagellar assembly